MKFSFLTSVTSFFTDTYVLLHDSTYIHKENIQIHSMKNNEFAKFPDQDTPSRTETHARIV